MILKIAPLPLAAIAAAAAAQPLPIAENQIERRGSAKVERLAGEADGIRLRFDDPAWSSGVRLRPPAGREFWDLSAGRVLAADVRNLSSNRQLRLTLHLAGGGTGASEIHTGIALNPGESRTIQLEIPHRRSHAAPPGVPGPEVIDSDKIRRIEFQMQWPFEAKQPGLVDCAITRLRLSGAPDVKTPDDAEFFPFIDDYGQNRHGEWPAKIHRDEDLRQHHARELAELAASRRPASWNRFGGWADGPKLDATGHFRTAKHQGKWYFVDPEGRLFFSTGIDVLRANADPTLSTGRGRWFSFPISSREIPFPHWNLRRKYGREDYEPAFYQTLARRLEHWGMNTIGNWGRHELMALGRTPYTLELSDYNRRLPRIAGSKLKFYDVFDPAFARAMKSLVSSSKNPQVARSLNDPMCVGYFIDNELDFGNRGRQMLGDDILRSPAKQAAKQEFVRDLKAKYGGVAQLNAAWKTGYPDWDALLAGTEVPKSPGYKADSDVIFRKAVDRYFRLCRDAVKSAAPHRLYLGCRFIATDAARKPLYEASRKYCDVLSVNVYAHSVANFGGPEFPDMPVLIGEFHFGVRDRGMFSPGLAPAGLTQNDRALAYTRFMQGALAHPKIVGAHWFQFRDQPLTGRWDGEGYAIGFVDVADTPYPELIRASRAIGESMYSLRSRNPIPHPADP